MPSRPAPPPEPRLPPRGVEVDGLTGGEFALIFLVVAVVAILGGL